MSPDEFALHIAAIDPLGHMAVRGKLAKHTLGRKRGHFRHSLEFGFEFDPSMLAGIVAAWQAIADGKA